MAEKSLLYISSRAESSGEGSSILSEGNRSLQSILLLGATFTGLKKSFKWAIATPLTTQDEHSL